MQKQNEVFLIEFHVFLIELSTFIHNRDYDDHQSQQLGADSSTIARTEQISTWVVSDTYSIFGIIKIFPNVCF